ncbi:MAG: alpha-glucosidase [Clostridiaceae bacterium]
MEDKSNIYKRAWWKEAIAYQIYVRSFKDSNNDGIGDIKGIIEKIPYLKRLGVDAIYLNPINKSPNDDNGYDVSDYYSIMDEFGTMEDFDSLLSTLHKNNMRLIMDLVINHTSDEHPWFIEAKKSKSNKCHDFYMWRDGKNGAPPNNWTSFFGGSAWEYNVSTDEYYLHIFSKKQPDLNWENKRVKEAVFDIINFWKNKGVDGFRFDAINHLAKDPIFKNAEVLKDGSLDMLPRIQNLPPVHDYIKEIRTNVLKGDSIAVIGEAGGISYEKAKDYTNIPEDKLHMLFHFDMHSIGRGEKPWLRIPPNISEIKEKFSGWSKRGNEEGWNPVFYSNHDTTRTLSRLGDTKKFRSESAKLLGLLQMTMRGTPFIYYGDEIGMSNPTDFKLEDYRDVAVKNEYELQVIKGNVKKEDFLLGLSYTNRDNSRTPMQWDKSSNCGFSNATPWIRPATDYLTVTVESQENDPDSILSFYKTLIEIRKNHPVLIYGSFKEYFKDNNQVYVYERFDGSDFGISDETRYIIFLNMKDSSIKLELGEYPEIDLIDDELLISNYADRKIYGSVLELRPYEAFLVALNKG